MNKNKTVAVFTYFCKSGFPDNGLRHFLLPLDFEATASI